MAEQNKKDKEELQISVKLNDRVITISDSKINAIVTQKLNKKINDKIKREAITPELRLRIIKLRSRARGYDAQIKAFQHILGCLKKDLVDDEFAQPKRYAPHSVYKNIRMKEKVKNMGPNQAKKILTISDSDDDETPTILSRPNASKETTNTERSKKISCITISDNENKKAK